MPVPRDVQTLLQKVSRSMYLSLRVLPAQVRDAMGLGYLLCRAADTIADTRLVPKKARLKTLAAFRTAFGSQAAPSGRIAGGLARRQSTAGERELLKRLPEVVALWRTFPEEERELVKEVVFGVAEGMRMDLTLFPGDTAEELTPLDLEVQLDRYCAHIGGAPGRFWTKLCLLRLPQLAGAEAERLQDLGFRFGKGLQMVNILRDVAQDLRIGRCYFPAENLAAEGLRPRDLLEPTAVGRFRPLLLKWTRWASEHLEAGEAYVQAIPGLRLKAAVAWPLMLALKTLVLVERSPELLKEKRRVKVPRWQVYRIMAGSPWTLSSSRRFAKRCAALRAELERDLAIS